VAGTFLPPSLTQEAYLPPASLTPVANFAAGVTAINLNLEKDVIAGVSDTNGKFSVDVNYPDGRFFATVSTTPEGEMAQWGPCTGR
jgi:hypothetical protein